MYTVAWSAFFKWFGQDLLRWLSMGTDAPLGLDTNWMGTVGLIFGVLIFLSAFYPISWIYLIAAGIAGKIIGALWFTIGYEEVLGWNKRTIFHLVFNELIWLIPLIIIYVRAIRVRSYLKTLPD
jgi:hypothetical protein